MPDGKLVLGAAAAACAAGLACAGTVALTPVRDNTLYESTQDLSNAVGQHLFVGKTGTQERRRALVQFDLSSIPSGSTITGVTLSLAMDRAGTFGEVPIFLHKLTAAWGQGTSDAGEPGGSGATATPGDPTWRYSFFNTTEWARAGGDFVPDVSGSASAGEPPMVVTWSSQAGMVADVQAWLDQPAQNFGWLVMSDEVSGAMRFDSTEGVTPPSLVVTFTPPSGCGSADFDGDGDTGTDADIEAFFRCLAGNCCPTCGSADFNGDGDTGTDADIEAFFRVLAGGTC